MGRFHTVAQSGVAHLSGPRSLSDLSPSEPTKSVWRVF